MARRRHLGLLAWVYNIAHFIRAEGFFSGQHARRSFYSPVLAFSWFTLVLFQIKPFDRLLVAIAGSTFLAGRAALSLESGRLSRKAKSDCPCSRYSCWAKHWFGSSTASTCPVPSVSESIVFHIAAASFFHYLGSYFYASRLNRFTQPATIVAINIFFLIAGYSVAHVGLLQWAVVWLGPDWLTVWVALHLIGSDLLRSGSDHISVVQNAT